MNIFFLDTCPKGAARYHCNSHVSAMLRETAQLLSSAWHLHGDPRQAEKVYKKTHVNHPSAKWTRGGRDNYLWLVELWSNLHEEFKFRYDGRTHLSYTSLFPILRHSPCGLAKDVPMYQPPPAMALEFKIRSFTDLSKTDIRFYYDSVASYRNYYRNGKDHLLTYTRREKPEWI
jgi:hypothetical protein